ncbi:MAG: SpoIIE family protein phosphatase, partial [Okeania sp. SIO2H7]|nr:SpoIIE family protein phosphatase [Okeania sp. SIO2H7]
MSSIQNQWLQLLTARLSRRVVGVVFLCVVVIEGIILVPSVLRREKEFLSQIEEVSSGQVTVIKQTTELDTSGEELLNKIARIENMEIKLIGNLKHLVVGGALYQDSGELVGTFGEPPELSFDRVKTDNVVTLKNGDRFDAAWTTEQMQRDFILIFRHDISSVGSELNGFILRIGGLVVIISIFVTVCTWIALDPLLISPILCLRKDLIQAGEAIKKDEDAPEFDSVKIPRKDELGDVIEAFNQMFQKISEAISDRKQAEAALQESFTKVEAYSQALNKELEKGREIQKNFLPPTIVQKPNLETAVFFEPARQVAGDFYDVFDLANNCVGLVIADVCDKGVGAALFMALFRSLIRIFSMDTKLRGNASAILKANLPVNGEWIGESTATNVAHLNALQAVSLTNNYVAEYHGELGMFATLFFGVLEPETGLLTYINGGHEPLFII